ncbi:MAG TPA: hypothetical protein EYP60_01360 [bacterium (Candidatus Stahlbacteria)]|nr:hypothetical protein [Candidatus Stahlbacteria bacterium]
MKEVFGYYPYWRGTRYRSLNYELISTIAYFGVELNGDGNIIYYHGWPVNDLINLAHSHGVRVVLVGICFDANQIHSIITNSSATLNAIHNLLYQVENSNADGVNIDFEFPPSTDRVHMTSFMKALADTFHSHNSEYFITLCVTAVNWNDRFQCKELAEVTDGLVIMGYDYYWSGSPYAGPVAPLTGNTYYGSYNVTNTVEYYLLQTHNDNSKMILGVPYYGYDWPTTDSTPRSTATSNATAKIYSVAESNASYYGKLWDDVSQTPWYRYKGGGWHQCWYDDATSLSLKYDLVNSKKLKGIGIWALSYDYGRVELWDAIYTHFVLPNGIEEIPLDTPSSLCVCPNPFSKTVEIKLQLPVANHQLPVTLAIYDLSGRLIRNLMDEPITPQDPMDNHSYAQHPMDEPHGQLSITITWDGKTGDGKSVRTGTYFCKLTIGNTDLTKKLILIR